jgi:hypothetical protein
MCLYLPALCNLFVVLLTVERILICCKLFKFYVYELVDIKETALLAELWYV